MGVNIVLKLVSALVEFFQMCTLPVSETLMHPYTIGEANLSIV